MKILVISDTHKKLTNVIKLLKKVKDIDRIIHLGDLERDAEDLSYIVDIPIDYVAGNCDFLSSCPSEKILNFYNRKILLTHGHYYYVKRDYNTIAKIGVEKKVDVVLFGHTHVSVIKEFRDITIMNPGSISLPRDGKNGSYGLLEIQENGVLHTTIKNL